MTRVRTECRDLTRRLPEGYWPGLGIQVPPGAGELPSDDRGTKNRQQGCSQPDIDNTQTHMHRFNGHFPSKPGLASCSLDSQSPVILILSMLPRQAKTLRTLLFM